jgi:hypothetical protein
MQAAWIFSVSGPVIFTALVIFAGGVRSPESLPTQTVQASIHRSCFHTQSGGCKKDVRRKMNDAPCGAPESIRSW